MLATRYPLEVFWSNPDEGFMARAPDLPGCSAWGKDEGQAIREAHDAIAAWLKAAKAAGREIPEPSTPGDEVDYSGRFLLRVPRRLHAEVARDAKRQGVSLNHLLYLLAQRGASKRAA